VYHQAGIDLMTNVLPHQNILFGSEMIGAVKGIDPETGHHFDDTKRYVLAASGLSAAGREDVFFHNQLTVYPRLRGRIAA
jgi:4-oxalmesaconate hydratase